MDQHNDVPPSYNEATSPATRTDKEDGTSRDEPASMPLCGFDEKSQTTNQTLPSASTTPSSLGSTAASQPSIKFTIQTKAPLFSHDIITFTPQQPVSDVQEWRLKFLSRTVAELHRVTPAASSANTVPTDSSPPPLPPRSLAMLIFPDSLTESVNVQLHFEPHEAERSRSRNRALSRTDRLLASTGLTTTRMALDLPAAKNSRCIWQVPRPGTAAYDAAAAITRPNSGEPVCSAPHRNSEKTSVLPSSRGASAARAPWTPFPAMVLSTETAHAVLARFERFSPWSGPYGELEVWARAAVGMDTTYDALELVEQVVVTCAALVAMQRRAGTILELVEAGLDNAVIACKGGGARKEGS